MPRPVPLAEKYRPQRLSEVLGQEHVTRPLSLIVEAVKRGERDLPHLLFIGPAGTGKTTTAYALARELGWPIIELNASDERGIDVIRGKVKSLALSVGRKIILLDEADSLTEDAQHALRRIMERARDARFVLTANYEWRIIEPVKSRCAIFRFRRLPRELVVRRLVEILRGEGVRIRRGQLETVKRALGVIVDVSGGDMRKAINLLEEVLANKVELTPEAVAAFASPARAAEALEHARRGDLESALRLIEDILVDNRLDVQSTVEQLYRAVSRESDMGVRAELLNALARAEHALRLGGSPLIQLGAFIAYAWMVYMRGGRGG